MIRPRAKFLLFILAACVLVLLGTMDIRLPEPPTCAQRLAEDETVLFAVCKNEP